MGTQMTTTPDTTIQEDTMTPSLRDVVDASPNSPTTSSPRIGTHRVSRVLRGVSVLVLLLTASVVLAGPASADTLAADNPLDGITPSMEFLGPAFNSAWARLAATIWGLAVAVSVIGLMGAALRVRSARKGGYAPDLVDASGDVRTAIYVLAFLAGLAVVVSAVLFLVPTGA